MRFIHSISINLQKLLRYSNDAAIVTFLKIPLASFGVSLAFASSNILALHLKDLKLISLSIPALKLVASSFE